MFYINIVGSKIKVAFKVDDSDKNDYKFFDMVLLSSTGCEKLQGEVYIHARQYLFIFWKSDIC